MIKMEKYELLERIRYPRGRGLVQNQAWRRIRKDRRIINRQNGLEVYKEEYWGMTERIMIKVSIGEERRRGKMNDGDMINKVLQKYELEEEKNSDILYGWI